MAVGKFVRKIQRKWKDGPDALREGLQEMVDTLNATIDNVQQLQLAQGQQGTPYVIVFAGNNGVLTSVRIAGTLVPPQ